MGLLKLSALQGEQKYKQAEGMRNHYNNVRAQNPHLSAEAAWHQASNTATNRMRNGMNTQDMNAFYNRYVAGDPQQGGYNPKTRGMDPATYDKWSRANPLKSTAASFASGLASGATMGMIGSKQIAGYDDTAPTYDTMTNRVNASANSVGGLLGGTALFATAITGINRLRRGRAIGKLLNKGLKAGASPTARRVAAAGRLTNRYKNMGFGKEALRTTKKWLVEPARDAWKAVRHPIQTFNKKYNKYGPGAWNRTKGIVGGAAALAVPTYFAQEYVTPFTNLATGSLVNKVDSPENMPQQQQQQ